MRSARHLRAARTLAGLTQQQLAEAAGLHKNSIGYWETQEGRIGGHAIDRIIQALARHGVTYAEESSAEGNAVVLRTLFLQAKNSYRQKHLPRCDRRTVLTAGVALVFAAILAGGTALAAEFSGRFTPDTPHDGDTFWLCDAGACTKIRVCGIDAPERGTPGAEQSTAALASLLSGNDIRCVRPHGRALHCLVQLDSHS